MSREALFEKIESLTPSAKKQAEAFVEFLSQNRFPRGKPPKKRRFKFDWAGGLADMKDQFTAVELQHRISKWR